MAVICLHIEYYSIPQQAKRINVVAVGIGEGIKKETLQSISGGGPVVRVDDFDLLEEMMSTIKSSACSNSSPSSSPSSTKPSSRIGPMPIKWKPWMGTRWGQP